MTEGITFRIEKTFAGRGGSFVFRAAGCLARGRVSGCCGPSGSGKTTLLRSIAGLERPEAGEIRFAGRTWFSSADRRWVPPWKRSAALVFQDYPLLPHLSVLDNARYGAADRESAEEALELVGLVGLGAKRPRELSGGQRQRAALAGALAARPEVLLLDEPFNALDEELRSRLVDDVGGLLARLGITALLVSHFKADLDRLCESVRSIADLEAAYFDMRPLGEAAMAAVPPRARRGMPWQPMRA